MRNGRTPITSSDPVEVFASNQDSTSVISSTFYLHNAGPGSVRIGVNDGISDGYSGLPLAEEEKAEIRHAGTLFLASNTATELAPVYVHVLVTSR
jgi:hypothetical protein